MPGHCESSCTCPSGSVDTIFSILHAKLGLVKKLAMRLQIWCALRCHSAHLVGRRRDLVPQKCTFFAWSVPGSVFPVTQRKESAVSHQADLGGSEDDLGGGQAFHHQRRVRRRLPAVVGALWKVRPDRQYICGQILEKTFLCTINSFCFISFVAFDFDCTTYTVCPGGEKKKIIRITEYRGWEALYS